MLEHAREAIEIGAKHTREDLESNRLLELGLVRLVEIVGEAAARMEEEARNRFPEIPWQQVIGMRNRLIHGYDRVDLQILWDTVTQDLPPLVAQLDRILEDPES